MFREDEPATVRYLVVDARGAPARGHRASRIRIERLETKAARVRGAGTAYLTEFIDEWVAAGECGGTSTSAPLDCAFTPDAPGSYRLTATIEDTRGRPHTTVLNTWVVGKGQLVWRGGNDDALELVPEQAAYEIGDTARYLLKNPYPGAQALVTIERYGILKQWVQTLDSSTPVIEFAVEKDFMPGFYLSVLVMSPRVEAPPPEHGELDLGKPSFKIGYRRSAGHGPVQADPRRRAGQSRDVYKPGDKVRVRVQARPREREVREPIEIAVAVLDEAVLDLIQGGTSYFDPYAGFYTLDGLDVRNFSLLTRLVGRQKIDLKGANPGGDGGAAFSMRSVFKYVSYWNPSLELDSRGNGSFEFEVPDNLTGWRVLVLAATPTDRLGLGRRPVHGEPADRGAARDAEPGHRRRPVRRRVQRHESHRRRARHSRDDCGRRAAWPRPSTHTETVHLEPFARTTVQVPVEAARVRRRPRRAGRPYRFHRDGARRQRRRRAASRARRQQAPLARDGGQLRHVRRRARHGVAAVPRANSSPTSATSAWCLSPSVIGNVDGAFRYLRDYPYMCWEQRLTKGVMASHFTHLRDYLPPDLEWPEAAGLPEQTLAQAASFQAPNGGMAYYVPQDQYVSPYLSAYTALAFAWLRDDGHAMPAAVEAKLHEYLDAFLKRDVAPDFYTRGMASTVRAVALAALAKSGKVDARGPAALPSARRVHELVRQGALPAGRARGPGRRGDRARGRGDHSAVERAQRRQDRVQRGARRRLSAHLGHAAELELRDLERDDGGRDERAARSASPATCRSSSCARSRRRAAAAITGRTRRRTCSA